MLFVEFTVVCVCVCVCVWCVCGRGGGGVKAMFKGIFSITQSTCLYAVLSMQPSSPIGSTVSVL